MPYLESKSYIMFDGQKYLGCSCGLEGLMNLNDKLNAEVVEQVNNTQELVMLNSFALETDEFQYKKCLQDRVAEISSWRWVLSDLAKRLEEAIGTLRYEHKALRVVVQRVQNELDIHSRDASRPGALSPLTDSVEDAIKQEFDFLRSQKKKFEKMLIELEKQTNRLDKTRKRIEDDVLKKEQTISIEESCSKIDSETALERQGVEKKRKKLSPIPRWQNRCIALKRDGLQALTNAVVTRQQIRGARVQLSIAAQAYAARVDATLRRRLHANKIKIEELIWQREEAVRDMKSLDEELRSTELGLIENIEQARVVEARLSDRTHRPPGELTRDEVDRKLRNELGRLRRFNKDMRSNIKRINSLQNHLLEAIGRIDCYAEDLLQVVRLDEDRIRARFGDEIDAETVYQSSKPSSSNSSSTSASVSHPRRPDSQLKTIREEDEQDDYPFPE